MLLLENTDYFLIYKWVSVCLVGVLGIFIGLEILLSLNDVEGDNVNYNVYKWSSGKYYFVPFAWGLMAGHFFFGTSEPIVSSMTTMTVISAGIALVLMLIGHFFKKGYTGPPWRVLMLVFGILVGHFIWSMHG